MPVANLAMIRVAQPYFGDLEAVLADLKAVLEWDD